MIDENNIESDNSSQGLLAFIFSDYKSLIDRIAPQGWDKSLYKRFLHPTAEQQYEEYKTITGNLARLSKKEPHYDKSLIDFQNEFVEEESKVPEDPIYILGMAVYGIFSDNHEVISSQNKVHDLGSARGSGSFIADFLNGFFPESNLSFDYIDFYLESHIVQERADMTPFYEYIFTKLNEKNCSWKYSFPRLYIADLSHLKEETPAEEYNPQQAILNEVEDKKKREEVEKLRQELDNAYQQELEEAKLKPPPLLVQAYKNIFGQFPDGFPH